MISEQIILLRLFMMLFFSGLIGWERERLDKPAGFRTHILVGLGSTIIMIVSFSMADLYPDMMPDVGRIAAQVVSGIGFLGAGTIIREGFSVKGLTTAASLWITAAVGLAVGVGFYLMAGMSTLLVFITLNYFNRWEKRISDRGEKKLYCLADESSHVLDEIANLLEKKEVKIQNIKIESSEFKEDRTAIFELKIPLHTEIEEINSSLLKIEGIKEVGWRK